MLKLLVVSELDVGVRDGSTTHLQMLLHSLERLGHDLRVMLPDYGTPPVVELSGDVTRVPLRADGASTFSKARRLLEFQVKVREAIPLLEAREGFDACYIREGIATFGAISGAKRANLPVVLEVNGLIADELVSVGYPPLAVAARDALEAPKLRMADAHVVVSRTLARRYVRRYGIDPKRVYHIPNGVDADFFVPIDTREARRRFGVEHRGPLAIWVGYMVPWQDLTTVIRAWWRVSKEEDAMLYLAGDGPSRPKLERMVKKAGLTRSVRFLGKVPFDEVPVLLSAADIALAPKVRIPCSPLKLFEYMSVGLPVITADIPDLRFIKSVGAGLLYRPGDSSGMARALRALMDDLGGAREMGRVGRDIVRSRYTWDHTAARVASVVRKAGRRP